MSWTTSNARGYSGRAASVGGGVSAWKAARLAAKICAVTIGLYLVMRCVPIMVDLYRKEISTGRVR